MSDRHETRLPPAVREAGLRALSTGSAYAFAGAVAGALAVAYLGRDASWSWVGPVALVAGLAGGLAGAAQAAIEARSRTHLGAALAVACAASVAASLVFVQGIYALGVLAGGLDAGLERVVRELTHPSGWPMTVGAILGVSLGAGLVLGNDVLLRRGGSARWQRTIWGATASFSEAIVLLVIGAGVFQTIGGGDVGASTSTAQLVLVSLCCAGLTLVLLGAPLALVLPLTEAAVARWLRPRACPTSS